MIRSVPHIERDDPPTESYRGNLEYLSDELRRLDLLIRLNIRQQPTLPGPFDQFKGLVISEEEIDILLSDRSPFDRSGLSEAAGPRYGELLDALAKLDKEIIERRRASLQGGVYLSLPRLVQLFHLTPFDERCLVVCLAPELDRKYEKLFGYLHDDVTRKKPSVDLLLNLLRETAEERLAARLAFDPAAPMMKYRLLQITDTSPDGPLPLLSRPLKLDDRIVSFLLGHNQLDGRLEPLARVIPPSNEREYPGLDDETRQRAAGFVRSHLNDPRSAGRNLVFNLSGAYGSGAHLLARAVCNDIGIPLVVADVRKMKIGRAHV